MAASLPRPLCTKCRKHSAKADRKLCSFCLGDAARARARNSADVTKCAMGCGRERAPGCKRCEACLKKKRGWDRGLYQARAQRGQCTCCMASAEVGLFCFDHWLKNVGNAHGLGNKKGIALLKQLWEEQGGRCAVTGEPLIPGATASIDHAIPKSRGGDSRKENLRWVLLQVNHIKWDMTHEEFLATCRLVVRAHERRDAAKELEQQLLARSN